MADRIYLIGVHELFLGVLPIHTNIKRVGKFNESKIA